METSSYHVVGGEEKPSLNKEVYRLPKEGERLVIDASSPFGDERARVLESLEARIRRKKRELEAIESELISKKERLAHIEEHIKKEAEIRAGRLIEEARRRIEEERATLEAEKRKAIEEGIRIGQDRGFQEGLAERTALLQKIQEILKLAAKRREEILKAAEREIVELAILVAKKIIKREMREDSGIALANVKEALKKLTSKEEITIRLNVEDIEMLTHHKDEFFREVKGLEGINFKEDSGIERGGCRIDTDFGSIDATISTQLDEIRERLLEKAKE